MDLARAAPQPLGLVLLAALLATPAAAAANPPQSGATSDCQDALLAPLVGRLLERERTTPLSATVLVEAGSRFRVETDATRVILLFYNEAGAYAGRLVGATEGIVPADAHHASLCLQQAVPPEPALVYAPAPLAAWTYQDGL